MKIILAALAVASILVLAGCGSTWNTVYGALLEPNLATGDSPTQCEDGTIKEGLECVGARILEKAF